MEISKLRLPVEQYPAQPSVGERIEPVSKIGDVAYFDRLPSEPAEKPRQTLLPVDGPAGIREWIVGYIEAWNREHPDKPKSIRWQADESGLKDPNFGSVEHYATVNYDESGNVTELVDDTFLLQDGRLDERTGIATPGSVIAPIERRADGYYVHCFWQWRPAAWDQEIEVPSELTDPTEIEKFKALHTGEWMLSLPGGYARKVGALFSETAFDEAMEEAGLRINRPVFTSHSFNRARNATKIGIGFSTFERVGDEIKDAGELLSGRMAVRIDQFRSTDAMAMACVNFAREELGLISSGVAETESDKETIATLRRQIESLQAQVEIPPSVPMQASLSVENQNSRVKTLISDGMTAVLRHLHNRQVKTGRILPDSVLLALAQVGRKVKTHSIQLEDGSAMDYMPIQGAGVVEVVVPPTVSDEALDALEKSGIFSRALKSQLAEDVDTLHMRRVANAARITRVSIDDQNRVGVEYSLNTIVKPRKGYDRRRHLLNSVGLHTLTF